MPRTAVSAHSGVCPRVIDVLRKRSFWATAAGGFCLAYPLYFMITWLPFYLVHEQRLSMRDMVNKAALYYTIDAAAALATGWVTDFWIRRRPRMPALCATQPWRWDGRWQPSAS